MIKLGSLRNLGKSSKRLLVADDNTATIKKEIDNDPDEKRNGKLVSKYASFRSSLRSLGKQSSNSSFPSDKSDNQRRLSKFSSFRRKRAGNDEPLTSTSVYEQAFESDFGNENSLHSEVMRRSFVADDPRVMKVQSIVRLSHHIPRCVLYSILAGLDKASPDELFDAIGNRDHGILDNQANKPQSSKNIVQNHRETDKSMQLRRFSSKENTIFSNFLASRHQREASRRHSTTSSQRLNAYQADPDSFYRRTFNSDDSNDHDSQSKGDGSDTSSKISGNTSSALGRALMIRENIIERAPEEATFDASKDSNIKTNKMGRGNSFLNKMTVVEKDLKRLPFYSSHETALLFVDISGFTKLSTKLDVETLSKTINNYFELIVNEISSCGGDILKFAGDALFAEWPVVKVSESTEPQSESKLAWLKNGTHSLEDSTYCAAVCGANIVEKCSDFKVQISNESDDIAFLNVHCGLGAGEVIAVFVGEENSKKEFLLLGDPIDQVAEAEECAKLGELASSPKAVSLLRSSAHFDINTSCTSATVIARRSNRCFKSVVEGKNFEDLLLQNMPPFMMNEKFKEYCDNLSSELLKKLHDRLSVYVHPVVRLEELNSFKLISHHRSNSMPVSLEDTAVSHRTLAKQKMQAESAKSSSSSLENDHIETKRKQYQAQAELRSVYVMFIMPKVEAKLTSEKKSDEKLLTLLNSIMRVVMRELDRFKGHLRQFIVDDKGVVLIGTFGLRGSAFVNMISKHGLPASVAIHNALINELSVENRIGATIGKAYCGVVGGFSQHEFAVLGPSVNLAARLMASPKNPGILVDEAVRLQTTNRYGFRLVSRVMAKGYATLVPIFEPVETTGSSNNTSPNFVGRKVEIERIVAFATDVVNPSRRGMTRFNQGRKKQSLYSDKVSIDNASIKSPAKIGVIVAEPGFGKSALLFQIAQKIQRLMGMNQKQSAVSRSCCIEREHLVPFSGISRIFLAALSHMSTSLPIEQTGSASSVKSSSKWSVSSYGSDRNWTKNATDQNSGDHTKSMRFSKASLGTYSVRVKMWSANSIQSSISSSCSNNDFSLKSNSNNPSSKADPTTAMYLSRLRSLCIRLGLSTDYALFVGRHILKLENVSTEGVFYSFSEENIVSFMVDAIILCFDTDLSIIALDDVQWIDSYSWNVVLGLFEKANNILFICATRTTGIFKERAFLDIIQKGNETRFCEVRLGGMSMPDILSLCSVLIGTSEDKIDESFYSEIYYRSNGNPMFASEMIEEIKQLDMLDMNEGGKIIRRKANNDENDLSFKVFEEYFLNKLDLLDSNCRSVLQVCAILGHEFSLSDVMRMFQGLEEECEETERSISASINDAISERILVEQIENNADFYPTLSESISTKVALSSVSESGLFRFSNDKWLQSVLNTMLDERVRDLHRQAAETFENDLVMKDFSIDGHLKVFHHWKAAGNLHKATVRALHICDKFPEWENYQQCLFVLKDSLMILREKVGGDIEVNSDDVVLESPWVSVAESIDLELLVRVRIEIGRRLLTQDSEEMAAGSILRALAILEQCSDNTLLNFQDQTIFLDIASAVSTLYSFGIICDDNAIVKNETALTMLSSAAMRHVEDTNAHVCASLTFWSLYYASKGEFKLAIEKHKESEQIYMDNSELSVDIVNHYGFDRVAYTASYVVQWLINDRRNWSDIEERIHKTVNDVIMEMDQDDIRNNFSILFPLVITMKSQHGMVSRAKSVLDELVTSQAFLDDDDVCEDIPLLHPLLLVLNFAELAERNNGKFVRINNQKKIQEWILEEKFNIVPQTSVESLSLISEMCFYVAMSKKKKFKPSSENRKAIINKGISHALEALRIMRGNEFYSFQIHQLKTTLQCLRREIKSKDNDDISQHDLQIIDDSPFLKSSSNSIIIPYEEWAGNTESLNDFRQSSERFQSGLSRSSNSISFRKSVVSRKSHQSFMRRSTKRLSQRNLNTRILRYSKVEQQDILRESVSESKRDKIPRLSLTAFPYVIRNINNDDDDDSGYGS